MNRRKREGGRERKDVGRKEMGSILWQRETDRSEEKEEKHRADASAIITKELNWIGEEGIGNGKERKGRERKKKRRKGKGKSFDATCGDCHVQLQDIFITSNKTQMLGSWNFSKIMSCKKNE